MSVFIKHNINWKTVVINKEALNILKNIPIEYEKFINWTDLSENPDNTAIELLTHKFHKISWSALSKNTNEKILRLLEKYPYNIDWDNLSSNSSDYALYILGNNVDKINWSNLSENPNNNALILLRKYSKQIRWDKMSKNKNTNAIKLLNKHQSRIDWFEFFNNTNIFRQNTNTNTNTNIKSKKSAASSPLEIQLVDMQLSSKILDKIPESFINFYNQKLIKLMKCKEIEENSGISKIMITKMIYAYIKANNLFSKDGVIPDDAIIELFKLKDDSKISFKYSDIHKYVDKICLRC